jgi:hypothetical protein
MCRSVSATPMCSVSRGEVSKADKRDARGKHGGSYVEVLEAELGRDCEGKMNGEKQRRKT